MNVYKGIVVFLSVLCIARNVHGDEPDVAEWSFSGIAFEIILTKLEQLQDKIVNLESAMKQADLKLSDDMSKLSQRIDEKLFGEISNLSGSMKRIDEKLYGVIGAVGEHERTITQIFFEQQNQLVSVKKQGESIEQKLIGSIYRMDHLRDKIVEMESAMNHTDLKLSMDIRKLSGDMSELGQRMDEKLSGEISKLSQKIDENLSGVVGAISEQNQRTAQIFLEQQNHFVFVQKQGESIEQKINGVANQMLHNASALQAQSGRLEHLVNAQHEQMAIEIQTLVSKNDVALMMISAGLNAQNILHQSCKGKSSDRSGEYMIQPTRQDAPFLGYCDQTVFGGGWLVIQHRYDGSVNFLRNWTDYRNGFGSVDGEFWLGLERLHRLTTARPHELLVELKDWKGKYFYARYDLFQIGNEEEQYVLKTLGKHTGTADDSLSFHRGKKFSTVDRDNDNWPNGNRASHYQGAWWYSKNYSVSNLNGPYRNSNDAQSMFWERSSYKSFAFSRMSIRGK